MALEVRLAQTGPIRPTSAAAANGDFGSVRWRIPDVPS